MEVIIEKLLLSLLLGGIIGFERQLREKAAGLRTIIILCLGTTIFTIASFKFGAGDPSRVASCIITGIGFLGAGAIIQNHERVSGLTTASMIWFTAALGMVIGMGEYFIAIVSVPIVLIVLIFFSSIEKYLGRVKESGVYQITLDYSKFSLSDYEAYFAKNKLKIISTSQKKKKKTIQVSWKLVGSHKNHKHVRNEFMSDKKLDEFLTY